MRTQCIWDLKCFQISRNCCLFSTVWLLRNFHSADANDATHGERWSNHDFRTLCTLCIWDLQCFQTFQNYFLFSTFWLIRNFYSSDADHANYGKHSLNHQFRHGANSAYQIYSVFKLLEFAVSFAHFDFFEISTAVMSIMITMANIA